MNIDQTILQKVNEYFHNNESTKQYLDIISTAIERQKDFQPTINKYCYGTVGVKKKTYFDFYNEMHHIIPRSIDKELVDYKPNLVVLTGEEHFTCHKLLVDMCIDKDHYYSMCGAYGSMCFMDHGHESTPEEYATAKKLYVESRSIKMIGVKRRPFTNEHLDNMSKARLGKPNGKGEVVECYIIFEGKEVILDKFNSLQEAKYKTNGNHSKITEASNGNRNYSGTYNISTKQYNERRFSSKSVLPNNNYLTTYRCKWRKIKE